MTAPIITAPQWMALSGRTATGADLTAANAICAAVSAAIPKLLHRPIAQTAYDIAVDAPPSRTLLLPYTPVSPTGLSVYRNDAARGDLTLFTAADLLVDKKDYRLLLDASDGSGLGGSGTLECLTGAWGGMQVQEFGNLAWKTVPTPGAVRAVFTAGYAVIPADLVGAAAQAVTLLWSRRKTGMPVTSESWDGYAASYAATFAVAALKSPDVWCVLRNYQKPVFA